MPALFADHWLLLFVLSGAVLAVALFVSTEAGVARRVFQDFVFLVALPLVVFFGWALLALAAFTDLGSGMWQALIAGLVIASGWLTTAIFNELGKARGKAERLRDYHKAIYAEIGNALASLYDEGGGVAYGEATLQRMREDTEFIPFVPREHHDHVFDVVLPEIEVLPRQTIDAIVAYYSLIKSISALADDMRGETFRSAGMSQARRIAIYQDYLEMRKQAFAYGQHALRLIKAYAQNGSSGADAIIAQVTINSRDAGQSDLSPGSE